MTKDIFAGSKRLRRQTLTKRILAVLSGLTLLAAAFIAFFYIPYFKISTINIVGAETIRAETIKQTAEKFINDREYWILPRSSIFIFSEEMIAGYLSKIFPRLIDVSVKIDGIAPAAVTISVNERFTWAVVCHDENCYYASSDGFLFGRAPSEPGSLFLRISDERDISYEVGDFFIEPGEIGRVQAILDKIKSATDNAIDDVKIRKNELYYYEAANDAGWKIIFDSKTDPAKAAENFLLAYKNTLAEDMTKIDYIDLRFENRIFYKER